MSCQSWHKIVTGEGARPASIPEDINEPKRKLERIQRKKTLVKTSLFIISKLSLLIKHCYKDLNNTDGLEATLKLAVGARVMLCCNINVEEGLVNGALAQYRLFQEHT